MRIKGYRSYCMNDVLVHVLSNEGSEVKLLFSFRSIIVSFGCQVMRVFISHQMQVMLLNTINHLASLNSISVFKECLNDSAPIMLEAHLIPFSSN